jgi:hypothetical protein
MFARISNDCSIFVNDFPIILALYMQGEEEKDFGIANKLDKTAMRQITNCDTQDKH